MLVPCKLQLLPGNRVLVALSGNRAIAFFAEPATVRYERSELELQTVWPEAHSKEEGEAPTGNGYWEATHLKRVNKDDLLVFPPTRPDGFKVRRADLIPSLGRR